MCPFLGFHQEHFLKIYYVKGPVKSMKRQITKMKKEISADHIFNKRLVSRICKDLSNLNSKKNAMQLKDQKI